MAQIAENGDHKNEVDRYIPEVTDIVPALNTV
jgi:hypothetical protein